jgi:hypothetical protein
VADCGPGALQSRSRTIECFQPVGMTGPEMTGSAMYMHRASRALSSYGISRRGDMTPAMPRTLNVCLLDQAKQHSAPFQESLQVQAC